MTVITQNVRQTAFPLWTYTRSMASSRVAPQLVAPTTRQMSTREKCPAAVKHLCRSAGSEAVKLKLRSHQKTRQQIPSVEPCEEAMPEACLEGLHQSRDPGNLRSICHGAL